MKLLYVTLAFLIIGLQYQLWVADTGVKQRRFLQTQLATQATANAELQQRNRRLEADVADLKQGLQAIEERAREDLGMVKPGETFFRVIERQTTVDNN